MIKSNHAVFSEEQNDTSNLRTFVEGDGYVFVRDRPAINHALYIDYRYRKTISVDNEKIHCPFAMAKKPFLKKKRSFAYPIGSNLSELFDPELLNLVESGIIKHLSVRGLPNAEICPQDLGGTERQLRNGDLMMTYYIMAAGFITSLVVFTTEFIFRYINSQHTTNALTNGSMLRKKNGLLVFDSSQSFDHNNQHSNITPPPPYQSIFSNNFKMHNDHIPHKKLFVNPNRTVHGVKMIRSESRKYNPVSTETVDELSVVQWFSKGRNYLIQQSTNGHNHLVPVQTPSLATFQYTYTE
ncbi:uncharacterized protein LOC119673332 [Teleopsis dalmanni]|uniref:uncharacterized protein LOC119673332 n=1 Tax=Teleopsis dalmanni TaxID=139649 RepID=UPI0018CD3251|nr:uncharacterized protein LOC119673332 [Teleopsis dalmanni]